MQGGVNKPEEITFVGPCLGTGKVLPPIVGPVPPHSSDNRLQTTITEQINHFRLKTEIIIKIKPEYNQLSLSGWFCGPTPISCKKNWQLLQSSKTNLEYTIVYLYIPCVSPRDALCWTAPGSSHPRHQTWSRWWPSWTSCPPPQPRDCRTSAPPRKRIPDWRSAQNLRQKLTEKRL